MSQQERTILIVDDCLEDREVYRWCLLQDSEYKYTVLEASSGEAGLKLCQEVKLDGVLLDYLLPDLDGLEFLTRLREQSSLIKLPIIMLTGQGNESIAVQAMKAGVEDYLIKGQLTLENLQWVVNSALEKAKLRLQLQEAEVERLDLLKRERAARLEAESSNRIKDEFLAVLSHELRSPLNPILGWTQLLQTRQFNEAQIKQGLEVIERNVKLQTRIIDDLLDVARLLRGKLALRVIPVNLVSVINAALETVETASVAKSITVETELANVGEVQGDSERLQQVIWNLLSNAIKFTADGGRVKISLEKWNDHRAKITVSDTGKGISAEFLPHVFDDFRQADASTSRTDGGLGLGLSIVRRLVEMHGGVVSVFSPGLGQGATFSVMLPLQGNNLKLQPKKEFVDQVNLAGVKILYVDDELDGCELFTCLMQDTGATVMTAISAAEGFAAMGEFQPDLLISDIGMSIEDGYTFLKRVRSLSPEKGGKVPAIALTAYARPEDEQRAIAAGFQQHLSKPVELKVLIDSIVRLLKS
ncbi:response regulator [Cronbergia sp. UHCC 0137]|uniref:ATP-binding response regulator n=1 Tax=Cronbergia sp. UHCC 0137 TaxID=3110239 RepID=UPI002B1FBF0F|nr:response regulator [Cronbergia sp. UHCC 0137]MEA5617379.1 response regulator [Cronbergia sp. UHCC 0137]